MTRWILSGQWKRKPIYRQFGTKPVAPFNYQIIFAFIPIIHEILNKDLLCARATRGARL